MRSLVIGLLCGILAADSASAGGTFLAGRDRPPGRDRSTRVLVGTMTDIEGMVEETTRDYYDVSDQAFKQDLRENYDLNDFGMDGTYGTFGLSHERVWKYFSMQIDALVLRADASSVASRNYYISVGEEIVVAGYSLDRMMVPEGTPFSMDLTGGILELRGLFTPFTYKPSDVVRLTPWIDLAAFGFAGYYEIDAGPAQGVTEYQNPPELFAVSGSSDGLVGAGVPELGFGGELRFGGDDSPNLVVQARYGFTRYDGSSAHLTTADHREKDIDLDHSNLLGQCFLEYPLGREIYLALGIRYQKIESEILIESKQRSDEEVILLRERFNKQGRLSLQSLTAMLGLTF